MAITKTSICNGALLLLGQEPSLNDVDLDTSVYAGDLKLAWDVALDDAIRAHPWNFAKRFASIGEDTITAAEATAAGFAKRYTWPSDPWCLRPWRLSIANHGRGVLWQPSARYIYTDEGSPIYLEFLARVADTGLFDPSFIRLLELHLAAKCAFKITGAMSVSEAMEDRVAKFRPQATAIDSQESSAEEDDAGEFLESRL